MSEDKQPTVTELIEKLTESEKKISEYEIKVKDFEKSLSDRDNAIKEKDNEISKLQSILAKNFVASHDNPDNDIKTTSYAEAYNKMIKENLNKNTKV